MNNSFVISLCSRRFPLLLTKYIFVYENLHLCHCKCSYIAAYIPHLAASAIISNAMFYRKKSRNCWFMCILEAGFGKNVFKQSWESVGNPDKWFLCGSIPDELRTGRKQESDLPWIGWGPKLEGIELITNCITEDQG